MSLLTGVSLTAAFAATGFIAAFGREQFLGINLSDWSTQTLSLLAARCAADSFFTVLSLAETYWPVLLLSVILLGAGMVLLRHRKVPAWAPAAAESVVAVFLLGWLLWIVVLFEGPTIPMRGWVIAPGFESPLDNAICQLSSPTDPCRQASNGAGVPAFTSSAGITRLGSYFDSRKSDSPGALLLESSSSEAAKLLKSRQFKPHDPAQAHSMLYNGYATAIVACALALLYVAISGKCPESEPWSSILAVTRGTLIAVSTIATLMLPYVYGKIVDPALFPNASIDYIEPHPKVIQDGIPVPGTDPSFFTGGYPVVSETDKSIFILSVQGGSEDNPGGRTKIIEVPRDRIIRMDYEANIDALAKIAECQVGKDADCQ